MDMTSTLIVLVCLALTCVIALFAIFDPFEDDEETTDAFNTPDPRLTEFDLAMQRWIGMGK